MVRVTSEAPARTASLLAAGVAGVVAVTAALFLLLLAAPALATPAPTPTPSAGTGETLQGRLVNEGEPLEGVTVTVTTADGTDVGEAESDEDGAFVVPLPEAGEYTITLDEDTLPEGVAIREGRSAEVTLPVAVGQQRNVLFPLGEGTRNVQTKLDRLPTLAVEGLQFGLIVALAAVGLSLIYGTTGLTNFAHGELITLGALLAYWIYGNGRLPFLVAGLLAVIAAGVLGGAQDRLLWRPLRKRGTGLIAMLVVTIGLALFLRYFFLYLFGGSSQPFRAYESQSPISLGPIDVTPRALVSMAIAVVVLLAVAFALLRTRIGKATRAVADNPALASSSGIDVERVIQVVWISGAALAGLAGVLLGLAQQVSFQLGFQILLLVFAAVTLGGLGTAFGALVGSLVVGIFTQVSTLFIPSELKNAGALVILILILLVRPQGILGRAERVG
ncbi:MAG: branched-chain amino acid ABC transporter permease [Actinomycetota bacterium]|nr:branched-chain amino acid ABC transporter permease [Actinomycetota bacterium]